MAKRKSAGGEGGGGGSGRKTPKKVTPPKRKTKLTPDKGQCTLDSFFKKKSSPVEATEKTVSPESTKSASVGVVKKQIDFDDATSKTAEQRHESTGRSTLNLDNIAVSNSFSVEASKSPSAASDSRTSVASKSTTRLARSVAEDSPLAALKSHSAASKLMTSAKAKQSASETSTSTPKGPNKDKDEKGTILSKAARTSDFSSQDESDSNDNKERVSKLSQKLRLINGYSSHDLRPTRAGDAKGKTSEADEDAKAGIEYKSEEDNYSIVSVDSNALSLNAEDKNNPSNGNGESCETRKSSCHSPLTPVSPNRPVPAASEFARRLSPRLHEGSLRREGQRRFRQTSLIPPKENAFEKAKKCAKRNPFEDCESWPKPEIAKLAPNVGRPLMSPRRTSPRKRANTSPDKNAAERKTSEKENLDSKWKESSLGDSASSTTRSKESPGGDSGFVNLANSSFSEETLFVPATPEIKPKKFGKSKSGKPKAKCNEREAKKSESKLTESSSAENSSTSSSSSKRTSDDADDSLASSAKRRRKMVESKTASQSDSAKLAPAIVESESEDNSDLKTRLPFLAESQGFEVCDDNSLELHRSSPPPSSRQISQQEILPDQEAKSRSASSISLNNDAAETPSVASTVSNSSTPSSSQPSIDVPLLRCRVDALAQTLVGQPESSQLTDGYLTSKERPTTSQESCGGESDLHAERRSGKLNERDDDEVSVSCSDDTSRNGARDDATSRVGCEGENSLLRASSAPESESLPSTSTPSAPNDSLFDASFGDDDFPSVEDMMTVKPPCASFGRHKVLSVERITGETRLEVETWNSRREKRVVLLGGTWAETIVEADDVINVIGPFVEGQCIVSDHMQNYVIVHPDLLVNGTAIAGALKCTRKAVFNEAYKGLEGGNIHMLKGTLLHLVFQEALKAMRFDSDFLQSVADKAMSTDSVLNDLVQLGIEEAEMRKQIASLLASVKLWAEKIVPGVGAEGQTKGGDWPPDINCVEVTSVVDIEENFWSPLLGIKGKVDCSAEVTIHPRGKRQRKAILPLELKTGKPNVSLEHSGQVALYALMFGMHRPERSCDGGLLVYLQGAASTFVEMRHYETQALTQVRNRLAAHIRRGTFGLPEPVDNERTCKWCPHQLSCVLYKKRDETLSGGPPVEIASHLTASHVEYFTKWSRLIATEAAGDGEKSKTKTSSFFWCRTPEEQEKAGVGVSNVVLSQTHASSSPHDEYRVVHVFTRARPSLPESRFVIGDSISVTPLKPDKWTNHLAIGVGTVQSTDRDKIELIMDRDLKSVLPEVTSWRLDKVDMYNNHASSYVNLIRLMEDSPRMKHLRELVIDFKAPTSDRTCHRDLIVKTKNLLRPLNVNQQQASLRSLMAHDFVLIRGMPGAGKTSTIVALVRVLVAIGASVLLTSFTHSAVDNILLKLVDTEISFLRLGRKHRLHPKLVDFGADAALASLRRDSKSEKVRAEDVANLYASYPVVATTCLGLKHAAIARRTFDYCIVDEASQVLQPLALGPLFHAKKFILVGDPQQLPPVVTSKVSLKEGMDESLMSALMKSAAKCLVDLNVQYRMNETINQLANHVVYGGLLKCGSDEVGNATICLQRHDSYLNDSFGASSWIAKCLSKSLSSAALFLSTESMRAFDSSVSKDGSQGGLTNVVEATLVKHICQVLVGGGISSDSVGVITPYRSQVQFLKSFVSSPVSLSFVSQCSVVSSVCDAAPSGIDASFAPKLLNGIEINTVDQYQGRDKSVIIVSFVRSRPDSEKRSDVKVGKKDEDKESMPTTILHDLRRLNVAITRAKHKVILIGNPRTLDEFPPLAQVLEALKKTDSIINLPRQAHEDIRSPPLA